MPKAWLYALEGKERETLSLGLDQGPLRTMATVLGRAPSTVSREHARNAKSGLYRTSTTQTLAVAVCQNTLDWGFSPERIVERLRHEYPDDMRKCLSVETIFVALYVLPRGALRQAYKTRRSRTRGTDRWATSST